MKSILRLCFTSLLVLTLSTACDNQQIEPKNEIDLSLYKTLSSTLEKDFQSFEIAMKGKRNTNIIAIGEKQFGISTSEFVAFKNAVEGNGFSTERTNYYEGLSDIQRQEVEIILNEITNYSAINELNSFLENKFDDYANSSLSIEDKNFLLIFITRYKASLNFIYNNQSLFVNATSNGRTMDWWEDWGSCAAGVTGEAILGAGALGLGGAAVGTVTLPVIGTVSAATVGVIVGGIGGAMKGAADYC